ncbi:potassium transporter Trk [Halobacteriales archaeon QS_8_65_32]|jgi:trk system potassium uptake protein TrkA|nr:MAG: potassium transporter Trk [Halobacteriales archaeon QS_8_65_32]
MQFVIVGAGRVGLRTARVLSEEGHEVSVVEPDAAAIADLADAPFDVVSGDGSREAVLEDAGVAAADAIGALTGDLNANFVTCMIGKAHDCRTVMRIDEDYREEIYREYASEVDEIIYPERLGAIAAKNALIGGNIRAVADIAQGLQVVELEVTDDSPTRGYTISEVSLPANSRLLAFGKQEGALALPDPDAPLELGDRLVVLADFEALADVRRIIVGDVAGASASAEAGGA